MKFPRKTKKVLSEVIAGRWPRTQSKAHRRLQKACRLLSAAMDTRRLNSILRTEQMAIDRLWPWEPDEPDQPTDEDIDPNLRVL